MAEIYNFFGDIFDYLRENYFSVEFGQYRNFNLSLGALTLSQFVFALMLGCMLAAAATLFCKRYLGRVVRALLAGNATDEESARSLSDLGLRATWLLRRTLSHRDSSLRRYIRIVGYADDDTENAENEGGRVSRNGKKKVTYTDIIDFESARFYIPPMLAARAEVRFDSRGTSVRSLLLALLLCLLFALVLLPVLPPLLQALDDMMTAIEGW